MTALFTTSAWAQTTARVSVDSGGAQGNGGSALPSISSDGRYVAFYSDASNLVPGDTNGVGDTFVHDRQSGVTTLVSVDSGGVQGNGPSVERASISSDGRYVAFPSDASNLVPGDTNGRSDVFVHDRQSGATTRVSVDSSGTQANHLSNGPPSISADGRYVAFESAASNLVAGDTNGKKDIFVHDGQGGATTRVSVTSGGAQANGNSFDASMSSDGRYVSFWSDATNLVAGDTNSNFDIFVHDRQSGTTTRVSVDSGGAQANNGSIDPSISADGRYVTFYGGATNLVPGDTNGAEDVFVHDRQSGATTRVSVDSGGAQANGFSQEPSISADGRYVAFHSSANTLVTGDTNGARDVFLHDRQSGETTRMSVDSSGSQGNGVSHRPLSVSSDGRYVAFTSEATNLVPGDTNAAPDVFVRDRGASSAFPTACFGDGSGAPCGCGNEASPGSDSGCLNGLGVGAALTATGTASVTNDTLQLTSSGLPTQPGLFFQGDNLIGGGTGLPFGDGIRCCGSNVVRLEIVVPPPPEPATASTTIVISQHAPPGTVNAGDTKCYQHWYRNPGSSPCGTNFNLSNAVLATWEP